VALDRHDADPDEAVVRRLADHDATALADLYDRHARSVFSLALRIVRDQADAEEVVQDVFGQAWRQAGRYSRDRGAVRAWLLNMTRSRAIDLLRARQARPGASAADPTAALAALPDPRPAPDVQAFAAQAVGALRRALDALPATQRLAIELAYYEGLSQTEIAERLEQPLGTVKTRIRLALIRLREAMAGETA
jgi:RNA polymerase sigma-70 factor (ECF subfamily)